MIIQAGSDIPVYTLNYSSRARRIRLSVQPEKVIVTAPENTAKDLINMFVRSRSDWIREKLNLFRSVTAPSSEVIPVNGSDIWLLGEKLKLLVFSPGKKPVVEKGKVLAGEKYFTRVRLQKWLDSQLLKTALPMMEKYSGVLGVAPRRVRLGNAVTRWGSCSSKGVIMINRKLVHAPAFVIDYIVAHEMVHLVHRNHSQRFHRELNRLVVDVESARKWLRYQGAYLLQ